MRAFDHAHRLLTRQMGQDVAISLATSVRDKPSVRVVDGYYYQYAVYVVTHRGSSKMRELAQNPQVALCHGLNCFHGVAEDIGSPLLASNAPIAALLREAFCSWYFRHVNELDEGTCILKIHLKQGIVFADGLKYRIDYEKRTAQAIPFVVDIVMPQA